MPSQNFSDRKKSLLEQIKQRGSEAMKIFKAAYKSPEDLEFAAMCALRQPSGARYSDRAADENIHRSLSQMSPVNRKKVEAIAKRAGISIQGKAYRSGLGPPSDPAAWVSCADDIRRVAKAKNLTVEGAVKHQGVVRDPPQRKKVGKRLAPDIVATFEKQYMQADERIAAIVKKDNSARKKLRAEIVERHGR